MARFAVVGGLNTLVDFAVFNLLIWAFEISSGTRLVLCNVGGFLIASLNSYLLNKNWTFEESSPHSTVQYLVFLAFSAAGLAVNSLVLYLLTTHVPPPFGAPPVLWVNFAKVCATAVSMVWNFLAYRYVVFNEKGRPIRAPL